MRYEIAVTKVSRATALFSVDAVSAEAAIDIAEEMAAEAGPDYPWLRAGSDLLSGEIASEEDKWMKQ
jgi:hypothetical protein